jgi:hypothetical protein
MKKINPTAIWVVLLGLLLSACATVEGLRPGTGSVINIEGRTYEQIWKAAVKAANKNLTIVYNNKLRGEIRAEAAAKLASWGEVVGVFISPTTPTAERYTVEVVSQKRSKFQLTGQNWERSILASIQTELDM